SSLSSCSVNLSGSRCTDIPGGPAPGASTITSQPAVPGAPPSPPSPPSSAPAAHPALHPHLPPASTSYPPSFPPAATPLSPAPLPLGPASPPVASNPPAQGVPTTPGAESKAVHYHYHYVGKQAPAHISACPSICSEFQECPPTCPSKCCKPEFDEENENDENIMVD
ncbi:hypothetical protein OS493_014845, partial [Desmophyllum pertusum]